MEKKLISYLNIEDAPCGHQAWWGEKSNGKHFGCGVIAGVDGLIYRGLVGDRSMDQEGYLAIADAMWHVMRPNTGALFYEPTSLYKGQLGIGVYSLTKFKKGIRSFVGPYGHQVTFDQFTNRSLASLLSRKRNFALALAFIEDHIEAGRPVHLLSWREPGHKYAYHWLTIVGIKRHLSLVEVRVMTWGSAYLIEDFQSFWQYKGLMTYKAMVTYEVNEWSQL